MSQDHKKSFKHKNRNLHCEQVNLLDLADKYQTPLFVYSKTEILEKLNDYKKAFGFIDTTICYAVKANSNLAILKLLANAGAGFDVVSQGEMQRVLTVTKSSKIVFSGVAKGVQDIEFALKNDVYCLNVESFSELKRTAEIANRLGKVAPISIRVNPDVDANTHPYISTGLKENKFGVDINSAKELYQFAFEHEAISIKGIDCHIGSQLIDISPYKDALIKVLNLIKELEKDGITLEHIDLGGGLGVQYEMEITPKPTELANLIKGLLPEHLKLILEPGRSIVANAGVLLTKVEYIKNNGDLNFAIVDAGMNDLIRPSLYGAWQDIVEVNLNLEKAATYDVVGPVCETGDFLGKQRILRILEGNYLAVLSSGAYGFTMSSQYNSRPKACEILVENDKAKVIRKRETFNDLISNEIYE